MLRYMVGMAAGLAMVCAGPARADDALKAPPGGEAALIEVIKSAPKPEKAIACKQLAVIGSKAAVPALAALLPDPEMNSWCRIALEAIPGPEADAALRDGLGAVKGKQVIGVINSIGVRKDAKAVEVLTAKMKDSDVEVVGAAAAALGHIGGDSAATVLVGALAGGSVETRSAAAQGCIYCAEGFQTAGNRDSAIKLYDAVRKAEVAKQRVQEGTRGAIVSRGVEGIPLLIEQLRSPDRAFLRIGLRAAREVPGKEVNDALVAELAKTTIDRQALLIAVLADRGDAAALPTLVAAAKAGPADVRIAAIAALEALGNASVIPTLLGAAVDKDANIAQAARSTLARLPGKDVEAELLAQLSSSTGPQRGVLVDLAAERRIEGAFPIILKSAEDADPGVRASAIDTIGAMGDEKQAGYLAAMAQKTQDQKDRANIEKALNLLTGRVGPVCVQYVMPLAKDNDPSLREMGLHVLKGCGGPEALAAVVAAVQDKDDAVKDEAVRTLSTWPNRWPEDAAILEPLTALAKAPKKEAHKVLALRGYFQFVQGSKKLSEKDKLAKMNAVLPLATRLEEKRSAIAALREMGGTGTFDLLVSFVADATVSDEASSAIVNSKLLAKLPKAQKQKALKAVVDQCKNDGIRKQAEDALKAIR